jgi:hypothetical protein
MTMTSSMTRSGLAVAALAGLLSGCGSGSLAPPVQETSGLLGNGVFRWDCVTSADPTCGTGEFPTWVALGARFDLEFSPDVDVPDELGDFSLEPVSPTRLVAEGVAFEGREAGEVDVVALGGGYAIDYVPLTFVAVDDLELGQPQEETCDYDYDHDGACDGTGTVVVDPPVSLVLGEEVEVRARVLGRGLSLAGALEYEWESLTPELVQLGQLHGRSARVSVLAMGLARISVRAGDYVEVFELEVQEPPPEPATGTGTDGESEGSGTDAGTSDGGSSSDSGTGGSESGSGGSESGGSESGGSESGGSESGGSESGGSESGGSGGETDGATTTGGV